MPFTVDTDVVLAGFLAFCILIVLIIHSFSVFDRRALASDLDDDLNPLSFFERPDRGLIILFFGMLSLAVAAYVGWRIPAEIQQLMGGSDGQALTSDIATGSLARAAQVVGAISFLLIALRLLRLSLILAFALSMMALAIAAYSYVFA